MAGRFGKVFPWDLKVRQMGLPSLELAALIAREIPLPMTAEEYLKEVEPIQRNLFPTASLMPGTAMTSWTVAHHQQHETRVGTIPFFGIEKFKRLFLLLGAERLLRHLHSKGVPIALATSSSRENYDLKTQRHQQVFQLFDHIVTGSSDPEVKRGKPSPDIFLVCASRFPSPPPQPAKVRPSFIFL